MGEERRSTPRIRAYCPLRLHRTGAPHIIETLTKDVGLGGLRCLSCTVLPVSTEVSVELMTSSGEEPLTLRGRTVWFGAIPQSEQFDLGIVFSELSPQTKRRLSVYLDRISSFSLATSS